MCKALPGKRCQNAAFTTYQKAQEALAAAKESGRGLAIGQAMNELAIATAAYAATFKSKNPELHHASGLIRDEQVALMPTKPAEGEAGRQEWVALAQARDRLAAVQTATWQAEIQGAARFETTQGMYEEAVFKVAQAEGEFRKVAWAQCDTTFAAQDELVDAMEDGDPRRIEQAKAVFYLSQHHAWPEEAQARYRAALASNDESTIDAAWNERALAGHAVAQMPRLAQRAYPHTVLTRPMPGKDFPAAPWVGGRTRGLTACDTAQVRYLVEGASSSTKWERDSASVTVRDASQDALRRLWAYGYYTEVDTSTRTVTVTSAPLLSEHAYLPAAAQRAA